MYFLKNPDNFNPKARASARWEVGEYEFDGSYFGAGRVRGAAGKTPVFGLLKRGDKVFVPDCSRESLMPVIKGLILEHSTIYTDGWKACDGIVLNGYEHYRVSLETALRIPQRERVRTWQEPCQRYRELLEFRQEVAHEVQRWRYNHRNDDLLALLKRLYRKTYLD